MIPAISIFLEELAFSIAWPVCGEDIRLHPTVSFISPKLHVSPARHEICYDVHCLQRYESFMFDWHITTKR